LSKEKTKQVNLTDREIKVLKGILRSEIYTLHNTPVETKIYKKLEKALNKKRIKVSSAKGKGRGLQYWMCRKISDLINITYNQADDNCLIHSREMGQHGTDIVLRGDALKRFPFSVECKNAESFNIKETVKQAKQNQKPGTAIMIIYKCKEFKTPVAIMEWQPFSSLLADWLG
jgi:hypothetical protein